MLEARSTLSHADDEGVAMRRAIGGPSGIYEGVRYLARG